MRNWILPLYHATHPFRTNTVPRDATSSPPSGRTLKSGRASAAEGVAATPASATVASDGLGRFRKRRLEL